MNSSRLNKSSVELFLFRPTAACVRVAVPFSIVRLCLHMDIFMGERGLSNALFFSLREERKRQEKHNWTKAGGSLSV